MMKDKNRQIIEVGDMVRFKEDRYTLALGIVKRIDGNFSPPYIQITICGGGGTGDRLLSCMKNIEVVSELDIENEGE